MCTVSNRHKEIFVAFLFSDTWHKPFGRKKLRREPMTFLFLVQRLHALPPSYRRLVGAKATNHKPRVHSFNLGWSRSGSVICDHSDHGGSNEQMNPLWTRIHRFIWSTMIWVITGSNYSSMGVIRRSSLLHFDFTQNAFIHYKKSISVCSQIFPQFPGFKPFGT